MRSVPPPAAALAVTLAAAFAATVLAPPAARAERYFKGAARDRAFGEVARLREIQERHRATLMAIPGVVGLGIGLDRPTGLLIFDVMVDVQAAIPALPADVEGVPVKLVRQKRVVPLDTCTAAGSVCHGGQQSLPVEMGNTAYTAGCGACSLGFKACDVETGDEVYVTAAHCAKDPNSACAGSAAAGDPTYHRSPADASCALEDVIGEVAKKVVPICAGFDAVEAASVTSSASLTQLSIRDIGSPSYLPGAALPGDDVQKSGRTTGYTIGDVTDVAAVVEVDAPDTYCNCLGDPLTFIDQIRIERAWGGLGFPLPEAVYWSRPGDSGSAVLDDASTPAIVGLNVLGSVDETFGYANPISAVTAGLDLSLNLLDCRLSDPCAATETARFTSQPHPLLNATTQVRDQVLHRTERGLAYVQAYYGFTGDLVAIMRADRQLLARTAELYGRSLPTLQAMAAGRTAMVTPAFVQAARALVARYEAAAQSQALREALRGLRQDLGNAQALADLGLTVAATASAR
jgi:hypothetical protein